MDDWSYADVALQLARTGHFHYSGWGSPSVLFQSAWAAIWIRIFGFSFNLLRLVSLPFSLAFVLLTYALGRKIGLNRNFALFGSLIIATSPVFVPLACTFMTEPYACPLTLLCLYAAVCSAEALNSAKATTWLWIFSVAAILGGSDRQTVWVAPIVLIPFLLWKRRSDRNFRIQGIVAYAICLVSLVLIVKYYSPRYAPTELSRNELLMLALRKSFTATHRIAVVFLVALFLTMPAFFSASKLWRRLRARQIAVILLVSAAALAIVRIGTIGLVPFFGAVLTVYGILPVGTDGFGLKPILISKLERHELTFILLLVVVIWVYLLWRKELRIQLPRSAAIVFLLFACGYIPLMIPGAVTGFIYDRYALPLLPLVVICVLVTVQSAVRSVSVPAYICLIVFAGYAVVTTHDYSATLRARAAAVKALEVRGVTPSEISAGFEHDGWTQLQLTGHVGTIMYSDDVTKEKFWFWYYAPALHPEFAAVSYQVNEPVKNEILQIPYTVWTRPFHRKISIVKPVDIPRSIWDFHLWN